MDIQIAGIVQDSIVDGPGFRCAVFTQGCRHACPACHNPQSWDENGGTRRDAGDVLREILENPLTDGVTLTGGEPFLQAAACAELAAGAREAGLNVWTYSGFTWDELLALAETDGAAARLLDMTDVLVDGRFSEAEKSLGIKFRGSRNQRLIDVKQSRDSGAVVTLPD
ncbi:MAG: anaerobic ribonucleoside-triphosphate reductase activating protein [Oscillospiraceae bacterium]|jgi:anaerobic ribonucleoside-triphosphate reductase activating protein|nr:anaerobic ribonucleoside-triphosphate reductase activating protein [Oscillospiraceae bacterium]